MIEQHITNVQRVEQILSCAMFGGQNVIFIF
jgi:hypothetical protein